MRGGLFRICCSIAGDIDATAIHESQYESAKAQVNQPVRIAALYENVATFIKAAQSANADWLDQNRELAARYCATTLRAMKELKGDFALFQAAVNEYVKEPPSEESLRVLFGLIDKYPFWTDDGGLSDDSVKFMIEVATESGVLTKPMNAADVVDRETLNRAVELANQAADSDCPVPKLPRLRGTACPDPGSAQLTPLHS